MEQINEPTLDFDDRDIKSRISYTANSFVVYVNTVSLADITWSFYFLAVQAAYYEDIAIWSNWCDVLDLDSIRVHLCEIEVIKDTDRSADWYRQKEQPSYKPEHNRVDFRITKEEAVVALSKLEMLKGQERKRTEIIDKLWIEHILTSTISETT